MGSLSMLAENASSDDTNHRTGQDRELCVLGRLSPASACGRFSGSQCLLTLLLLGVLFGVLTPTGSALDRNGSVHSAQTYPRTNHSPSPIEQVRFNQRAVPFGQGVTVGPGAGNLEIQFAAPASGASEYLRYRLLGFDAGWKEAGNERRVLYDHLAPGRYEFAFQQSVSGNWDGSAVQSIPVNVTAPYWQTGEFRALCILLLLVVILGLHKLRVSHLVQHVRKLQETVARTKAELTLAAKIAGDAQEVLKEQALKDNLTGLWNRKALFAMLQKEVYRAQRDEFPITLVMIDMDHFKAINDTHGHLIGDEVLREAASRLSEVMRPYDFAGRYGGEEFLIILPSCPRRYGAQRAEDFRRAIAERPFMTALGPLAVTCSVGIAVYDDAMKPEDLIHRADEALYRAKSYGRNCVCAAS